MVMDARDRDLIDEFADWLFAKGRAAVTVSKYAAGLREVEAALGPLDQVTKEDLRAYQRRRDDVKPTTWNNSYVAPLRKFFSWLSDTTGRPNPSTGLSRRAQPRRARRQIRGLARRSAELDPLSRRVGRLIYLTGLNISAAFELIEMGADAPDVEVPGPRGKLLAVHLEPKALRLVRDLHQEGVDKHNKRTVQKYLTRAGLQSSDFVEAHRRHSAAGGGPGDSVAPALAVLVDRPELERVTSAYETALHELEPGGHPTDAITDAARALQEMLLAVGASGDSLGRLAASLRKHEWLAPHDSKLAEAIDNLIDWVSADRSKRGDAHRTTPESQEDAWLTVRVVGALLLRLEKHL